MPWWLIMYLIGAAMPALAVVASDGWRAGTAGDRPSTEPDDLRAAVLLGVVWPVLLAALVMLAVAWLAGRVVSL